MLNARSEVCISKRWDLISLNVITIELSASCCLLSFFLFIAGMFFYIHFKSNIFPSFGLLTLSLLWSAAGMFLIFYLEFAMIWGNGMDKFPSQAQATHFTNFFLCKIKSFSSENFLFKTPRKILHVIKSHWIFKLFWFGSKI